MNWPQCVLNVPNVGKDVELRPGGDVPDLHQHQTIDAKPRFLEVVASAGPRLNLNGNYVAEVGLAIGDQIDTAIVRRVCDT